MDTQKTPTPAAKKRSAAAQERLDQIVSAAVRLINARGFNGMSLQAVADEVGITQAGVLHYVGSKHGLLVESCLEIRENRNISDGFPWQWRKGSV